MSQKNLFVPLNKESFNDFLKGKRYELRKAERGWNKKQLYTGRNVTLSCGYSGQRLYGKIGEVIFGSLDKIFSKVQFNKIEPLSKSKREARTINLKMLGQVNEYVAFEVILDGK